MSPSDISLILLCSFLGLVVLYAAVVYGKDYLFHLRQPTQAMQVVIVQRRIQEDQGTGWSPSTRFIVSYRDETGSVHEVSVPEDAYSRLMEGQEGVLRLQGGWFRGFTT